LQAQTVQLKLTGFFEQFSFGFLLNVAKDSGLMGKSFTSFCEFQIFAKWLNTVGICCLCLQEVERRRADELVVSDRYPNLPTARVQGGIQCGPCQFTLTSCL